ncbi:MAG: hypothetical protein KIG88_10565 [Weeksellaceae bacterium]|nr:hypothetical protein [Weeksellaceae bacterium]
MKKIILTLTLITSSLSFANDNNVQLTYTNAEMAPPQPTLQAIENDGLGAAPIDDYVGILLAAGVLAAGIIYYNKEKQIIKK